MILRGTSCQLKLIFFGRMERFKPQGVALSKIQHFPPARKKAAKISIDRPEP